MMRGKKIILRLLQDEEECRQMIDAYNDLSQRADTDHTEIKHPNSLRENFQANGLWGEDNGKMR